MALEVYDETAAKRVAWVMGEASAARKALNELARRRANGEDVCLYVHGHDQGTAIVVGPRNT